MMHGYVSTFEELVAVCRDKSRSFPLVLIGQGVASSLPPEFDVEPVERTVVAVLKAFQRDSEPLCVTAGVQSLGEIILRIIMRIEEKLRGRQLQVQPYGIAQSLAGEGTGYRPEHDALFRYWQIKRKNLINNSKMSHTLSGLSSALHSDDERLEDVSRLCKGLLPYATLCTMPLQAENQVAVCSFWADRRARIAAAMNTRDRP
ncbi:hypothetical protein AGR4A_Lc130262 [Agrobacterium tumefaciens str. B6]|uniref:Uncharacterized protein n=1 Tax=Agrobacterium tumefaciens str. B6 TaxID=1183423 RepID=A0A822V6B9_AGRTU|nr:hypothetical protein AGR4A_Lc130262 [Agrobacterium tumefaciens str. B6]